VILLENKRKKERKTKIQGNVYKYIPVIWKKGMEGD